MQDKIKKRIVVSASYGNNNLGDEAICDVVVSDILSIESNSLISILVFDKDFFLKSHPDFLNNNKIRVRNIYSRKKDLFDPAKFFGIIGGFFDILLCDLFIWGGGGIIRNKPQWLRFYIIPLLVAQFLKKKIFIYPIGIDKINNDSVRKILKRINNVSFFSVRDSNSKSNFLNIRPDFKKNISVLSDPVFHLAAPSYSNAANRSYISIGLNITSRDAMMDNDTLLFLKNLAGIFRETSKNNKIKIKILPTSLSKDKYFIDKFKNFLPDNIEFEIIDLKNPKDFFTNLADCDLFIGMRMHSVIMASRLKNIPIFIISYAEKTKSIFGVKPANNFFDISEVINNPERLQNNIIECLANKDKYILDFSAEEKSSIIIIEELKIFLN